MKLKLKFKQKQLIKITAHFLSFSALYIVLMGTMDNMQHDYIPIGQALWRAVIFIAVMIWNAISINILAWRIKNESDMQDMPQEMGNKTNRRAV